MHTMIETATAAVALPIGADLPDITVVMPAFNEAVHVAAIDYPAESVWWPILNVLGLLMFGAYEMVRFTACVSWKFLHVVCLRCDRRGRLSVARLIEQHGPGAPLRDAVAGINADCPKREAKSLTRLWPRFLAG